MQEHSFAELVQLHNADKKVVFFQLNQDGLYKLKALPSAVELEGDEATDYELLPSAQQELTFKAAVEFCQALSSNYFSLGICNELGQFTQLGLLVSDQCPFKTKVMAAQGTKFFSGSLLKQANAVCDYLFACNKDKLYSTIAIREALTNAFTHRSYSRSEETLIRLKAHSLEFISPGGLCGGLGVEDLYMGMSMPRNPRLVELFRKLNYVEAYGIGIRRIMKCYEGSEVQPQLLVRQNAFKLILPQGQFLI